MIKATELIELGKDALDVIQAWADPDMSRGKIAEASELGSSLWNVWQTHPEVKDHMKEFIAWVFLGMGLEALKEYATAGWVEWDLPVLLGD